MIVITIEEDGKKYRFKVPKDLVKYQRRLTLFTAMRTPLITRDPTTGKWLYRVRGCNLCGACCIAKEPIPGYMKIFGVKKMEGKTVCRFLEKQIWAEVPKDAPVDPSAPKHRTLGSPLKERKNAEVYVCTNPWKPFGCCSGPICTAENRACAPKECTILYAEIPKINL